MVCRMWKGGTLHADAAAYENYLRNELFPQLQNDPGKRGNRGFAGVSEKARSLLSRRQTWCDHYELSDSRRAP